MKFLDLFAGAGGLSEGFTRAGFDPVAHVEMDRAACFTLRTRTAYHWLKNKGHQDTYFGYLDGDITRNQLYEQVPERELASVINEEICADSLKNIFSRVDDLLGKSKLSLIIGGPPCQAYSIAGRSRDKRRMVGDKRNYLYKYYAEFLKHFQPKYFVFENVVGLASARDVDGTSHLENMKALFHEYGYSTEEKILSAANYGVLQNRKRMILVGKRGKGQSGFYPELKTWQPDTTVHEVFHDLPKIDAGGGDFRKGPLERYKGGWLTEAEIRNGRSTTTLHQARPHTAQDLEVYRTAVDLWNNGHRRLNYNDLPDNLKTHKHRKGFLDRFKVVAADLPLSQTVVAHIAKDGHYYIHPDIEQNRSLTPREAARLQTFPDDYYFESISGRPSRTPAFRQIGNAVPVLFAKCIAEALKNNW